MNKFSLKTRAKVAFNILTGGLHKKSTSNRLNLLSGTANFTNFNAVALANEGYAQNPIVFYCINLIANAASLVPLRVYKKKYKNGKVILEHDQKHELNKFIQKPNNEMSGQRFQHALHTQQLIQGNCFVLSMLVNDDVSKKPFGWDILRPERISIIEKNGMVTGYNYNTSNGKKDFAIDLISGKSPILHIKEFNPLNDFYGMSPLIAAGRQIDIANDAAKFNKSLLENDAKLTLAVMLEESAEIDDVENFKNQFIEHHAGAMNAGKPFLFQGVNNIQELGLKPKDMEFSESQLNSFRLIANALGVPTFMLGLRDTQSTFNNMQEAKTFFYQTTIAQKLALLYGDVDGDVEGELNIYLQKFYGDDYCIKPVWEKVDALSSVKESREKRAKELSGIITIDEQREMVGKAPLEIKGTTDIPWLGVGVAPITFADITQSEEISKPAKKEELFKNYNNNIEFKLINETSKKERQRELKIFDRLLTVYERKFAPKMAKIINKQAKAAAALYELNGDNANIDEIFTKTFDETLFIYQSHFKNVIEFFGQRVIDAFSQRKFLIHSRKETNDIFDIAVRNFIEMFAAKEVALQEETTKTAIKNAILQGEIDGKTRREIAIDIVKNAGGAVATRRALTIAKTETHSAANYAQKYAGIAATGEDSREWVSAEDGRTRPSHSKADGQVVKNSGKFIVGSSMADYPGDPNLPAEERIQCRCTTVFIVSD